MILQLIDTIVSQSDLFVSFQQLIDEIYAIMTPICSQVFIRYFGLMGQYFIAYLFSWITHVRPSAKDNFVNDDT